MGYQSHLLPLNIRHSTHRPAHNDSEGSLPDFVVFNDDPKLEDCGIVSRVMGQDKIPAPAGRASGVAGGSWDLVRPRDAGRPTSDALDMSTNFQFLLVLFV